MSEQKTNEPKRERELIDRLELYEKARRIIGTKASYKTYAMLGMIRDAPTVDVCNNTARPPQTIGEIVQEVTEAFCSGYCKWPEAYGENLDGYEIMIDEKCETCPLNRLS